MLVGAGSVCLGYTGQALYPAQLVRPPPRPGDEPRVLRRRRGLDRPAALAAGHDRAHRLAQRVPGIGPRRAGRCCCRSICWCDGGRRTSAWRRTVTPRHARRSPATPPPMWWITPGSRWTGHSVVRMRTSRFWWIAVGYFCALFAWYAVQVHQTKYLVEIGFSPALAAWALGWREPRRHPRPDRTRPPVGSHRAGIRLGDRHARVRRSLCCSCCCCTIRRRCRCCT